MAWRRRQWQRQWKRQVAEDAAATSAGAASVARAGSRDEETAYVVKYGGGGVGSFHGGARHRRERQADLGISGESHSEDDAVMPPEVVPERCHSHSSAPARLQKRRPPSAREATHGRWRTSRRLRRTRPPTQRERATAARGRGRKAPGTRVNTDPGAKMRVTAPACVAPASPERLQPAPCLVAERETEGGGGAGCSRRGQPLG